MHLRPQRLPVPDRAGLALLGLWIAWAVTAAALQGQLLSPLSPYVVAPVSLVIGIGLGRAMVPHGSTMVLALILLAITGFLLLTVLATAGPAKGPTGYANANGALAVQVIGLSGLAIVGARGRRRTILLVTIVGNVGVIVANSSMGALGVAVPVLAAVAAVSLRRARRWWRAAAVVLGALLIAASGWAVVALADRSSWPSWASRGLDQARHTLWSEALGLWSGHPVAGVGPGNFQYLSTLGYDPDTAAAHSSLLQVGAETGWVGVGGFSLILLSGLLWVARGAPAFAVVGAASWTAVVVHSFADHLVDFPFVVLAAGAVVGWAASGRTASEELDIPERERPVAR